LPATNLESVRDDIYLLGTQMTLVLIGKGLLFEGSTPKPKHKQVPGIQKETGKVKIKLS